MGRGLHALLPPGTTQFTVHAAGGNHDVIPCGTVEASGPIAVLGGNVVLLDCQDAARLLDHPGRVDRIDIGLAPGVRSEEAASAIVAATQGYDGVRVRPPDWEDDRIRESLAPLKVASLVISAGALVVGMFLVYNTLSVSVAERRHDIGVLRSIGATRGQISRLFLGEAVFLGLLGALVGIPFGLGLARLMMGPIGSMVVESLGTIPMRLPALAELRETLWSAAFAGLATSMAAALVPALRAAREEPADAVRRVPLSAGLVSWR